MQMLMLQLECRHCSLGWPSLSVAQALSACKASLTMSLRGLGRMLLLQDTQIRMHLLHWRRTTITMATAC